MRYHKQFKNFKPETIKALKSLRRGWKDSSIPEQIAKCQEWLNSVCEIYNITRVEYVIDANAGSGVYYPSNNTIHMSKPSIITLTHEFRHAMQCNNIVNNINDAEDDARG